MFSVVLAKLLPERHNLYGNSLDFKLNIYKKMERRVLEHGRSIPLWAPTVPSFKIYSSNQMLNSGADHHEHLL